MEIENGSDTGFGSDDSSEDEIVEEFEARKPKRKHEDDDDEDEEGSKEVQRKDGKKKKRKQEKFERPPTAEELNRLRETENLFHSNLFRLQVEEMLKEVKFKEKNKKEFKKWFEKFQEWVLKIEDGVTTYNINDQSWLKGLKVKIPIPHVPQHTKGSYLFKKPNKVEMFGSYALGLTIGSKVTVDVVVEMPQSFFYKDDFLNSIYHRKRALYLCQLAHHIQSKSDLIEDIHFVADEIDTLRPRVEIIPSGKIGKCVTVLLHLVPESNTFKLSRFSPTQSNIRSKWFFNDECSVEDTCPTPFYNSSILADLTACTNHLYLKNALYSTNNIKDGIRLLKIWLHQRELDQGLSNLNGFLTTMLVCYLLKIKKLNIFMSSYQVFRIVCNYLSSAEWDKNGIIVSEESGDQNLPSMEQFHEHHNIVFVDFTGHHNLCYGMGVTAFRRIKHEAQLALGALDNQSVNSFQVLFMTPVPFYRHYDHVLLFHNEEALENIALLHSPKQKQLSYCNVIYPQIRQLISELLIRGLNKRVSQIHVKQPNMMHWKITKKPQYATSLIIGLNLNPGEYFSVLEKAKEDEMKEFQDFWGDKSELRRFQDGTITEAVVWNASTFSEKRLICKNIVTYLMKLKFGYADTDLNYFADQLDNHISLNVEEQSLKIISTYDKLAKQLRELKDLPLDIINVQGTSPVNRYTDVYPPKPFIEKQKNNKEAHHDKSQVYIPLVKGKILPKYIGPVDVMIQMGASSKWPQTLEGIKRIKAAFNIKLAESLRAQFNLASQAFPDRVDVNQDGYVFRIKIACPFEIPLLQKSVDAYGMVMYRDTEESLKVEKESVNLPRLASALHGVHQEHNSFGSACCLVKRWVNSHLIDFSHISEEALELLVASLYLNPGPHEVPQQPQVAFLRFHHLMAATNWNTDCIILNINNEFTREDITEIESHFNTNRAELPSVFISTPHDPKKSIWTQNSPSPLILLRLVQLSKNVLNHIENQIYSKELFDHKILFEPSYEVFDVLIHLSPAFNPKKRAITKRDEDDDLAPCVSKIPVNGFDPVQCYLKELREAFEDFALFFYDSYGGSVIGVVWKPDAFELRDFKVNDFACRKYNNKAKKLEFNKGMVIEDFSHIGEGLVKEIVLNKR